MQFGGGKYYMKKFLSIICFIYSSIIIYVWIFGKLKYFLAPQMSIYLKLSIIPLLLMGFVLLFNNHLNYKFKISDLIFLLPVILLVFSGDGKLTLSFASSRMSQVVNQNKNDNLNKEKIDNNKDYSDDENKDAKEVIEDKNQGKEKVDIYFDVNDKSYNVLVSYLTYTSAAHKYEGKGIKVRGFSLTKTYLPNEYFMLGKYLISCCAADATYNGFIIKYNNFEVKNNTWYEIEGILRKGKDLEEYEFMYIDVYSIKEIDPKTEEEYVYPCYVYDNGACEEVGKYNLEY